MGGAASLSQIPEDLLNDGVNSSAAFPPPLTLSAKHLSQRDPLASLRRRSIDSGAPRRPSLSMASKNRRSAPLPRIAELPSSVVQLLSKVGINGADQGSTSALVAHIFECLGALQHVIRGQEAYSYSSQMGEEGETQSAVETNTKSIGKLLHEIVTLYGLCGDTVRVLLDAEPLAASVEDSFGRLPLHVAVDRDEPWLQTVVDVMGAFPEALECRDGGGRLPLHIAVDRQLPSIAVVKCLLEANPDTAAKKRGVGRLAIHYACFPKAPSAEVVACLLDAYPEGAKTTDVYGRLPLHYVVEKELTTPEVVLSLLRHYPEGAAVKDSHQRLPLSMACEFGSHAALQIITALYAAFPEGISSAGQDKRVPLRIAVEASAPSPACVHFLASRFPEAIYAPMRAGRDESSPLSVAIAHGKDAVIRALLLVVPNQDPQRLRDLNWKARRLAILLGKQAPPPSQPKSLEQDWEEEEQNEGSDGPPSPSANPTTTQSPLDSQPTDPEAPPPNEKYIAPYIIQLSSQHLLLSALDSPGQRAFRERSNSLYSVRSEAESALATEREAMPRCNLFQRLYTTNMDAFKVAVLFL